MGQLLLFVIVGVKKIQDYDIFYKSCPRFKGIKMPGQNIDQDFTQLLKKMYAMMENQEEKILLLEKMLAQLHAQSNLHESGSVFEKDRESDLNDRGATNSDTQSRLIEVEGILNAEKAENLILKGKNQLLEEALSGVMKQLTEQEAAFEAKVRENDSLHFQIQAQENNGKNQYKLTSLEDRIHELENENHRLRIRLEEINSEKTELNRQLSSRRIDGYAELNKKLLQAEELLTGIAKGHGWHNIPIQIGKVQTQLTYSEMTSKMQKIFGNN